MRKDIKKLYRGLIDLRDYDVRQCINNKENMEVIHNKEKMTLTPKELVENVVNVSKTMKSKVGGKDYKLFSYEWNPDIVDL